MATKAEPEEEEFGDVEPEVCKSKWEEGEDKSPGMPPPEVFLTLEQAREKLHDDVWTYIKDSVWNSVVLIEVPTGTGSDDDDELGTGFVFLLPGNQKLVMTNYHVVRNHDPSSPIRVRFFYDHENIPVVVREAKSAPTYYSANGIKKGVDEKHLDFAVLNVESIPDEVTGIDLSQSLCHYPADYNERPMDHTDHIPPKMSMKQGIIVGHPRGHHKRISIVDFQSENPNALKRKYSQEGTWRGSSGSPVLLNFNQTDMDISPVCFVTLHYGVKTIEKRRIHSVGVNIFKVINAIWDEIDRQEEAQKYMTLTTAKEVLNQKVWEDIKLNVWENVVHIKTSTNYGTGFVFRSHPSGKKLIITSNHVVKDHDRKSPIYIRFFYDSPKDAVEEVVVCEFKGDPTYYPYVSEETDAQGFAVLHVEGIPKVINGIRCEHTVFNSLLCDQNFVKDFQPPPKSRMDLNEGIIIGHPGGGPKRISIVQFKPGQMDALERHHSPGAEETGSSGSPILINAKLLTFPLSPVYALHYHKGKALILFPNIIEEIRVCEQTEDMRI